MKNNPEPLFSFWEHLDELRTFLIRSLLLWGALFILLWLSYEAWLPYLIEKAKPLAGLSEPFWLYNEGPQTALVHMGTSSTQLQAGQSLKLELGFSSSGQLHVFSPLEILSVSIKASLWFGAWFCLPFWLAQAVRFIKPALYFHEQRWARSITCVLLLSWLLSTAVTPVICQMLMDALMDWIPAPVIPLWGLGAYVDFLLMVLLATASSLLLTQLMIMAAFWGWLTYTMLKKAQKGAILGSLIVGALLTPPDVLSQVALASVLLMAYYLALAIAGIKERLQKKR